MFWTLVAILVCVTGSALAAGLTIGLLSFDQFDMQLYLTCDPSDCETEEEKRSIRATKEYAKKVLPLLQDHHRLLVTLLLINCICAETLPLFLDRLVPSWVAVLISVTALLLFGEILPSAVFTSKSGLKTSSQLAGMVHFFLLILAPIAIPIGKMLDYIMGEEEPGTYSQVELRSLLRLHRTENHLTYNQSKMMEGAMDLMKLSVQEVMTPRDEMFMLPSNRVLDESLFLEVFGRGYSRVPVYRAGEGQDRIEGVLMSLSLILVESRDGRRVGDLGLRFPPVVSPSTKLHTLLEKKAPFFLVSDDPEEFEKSMGSRRVHQHAPKLLGCISAHDVMQCLTKQSLIDEYSMRWKKRRNSSSSSSSSLEEERNDNGGGVPEDGGNGGEEDELGPQAAILMGRWIARARESLSHQKRERSKLLGEVREFGEMRRLRRQVRKTTSLTSKSSGGGLSSTGNNAFYHSVV